MRVPALKKRGNIKYSRIMKEDIEREIISGSVNIKKFN